MEHLIDIEDLDESQDQDEALDPTPGAQVLKAVGILRVRR